MDDKILDNEWIGVKDLMRPELPPREPAYDVEVSKIVGKPVRNNDPRLFKLIAKWKKVKADPDEMDNFLYRPGFLIELKETFK